ncbi:hypothetical protein GMOD_00010466 [Pyrenophora seminiperda CCB06]|uniref:Uncharacterized protein n=1 Tax=Pyrenophora seminiperda CCB06 TaxID=1302712 RepID=A0A3M7MEE0_9PLEO|nr:hypothetical protein GMOD_00010466 [Pyrenophora seminiperda CCB06]
MKYITSFGILTALAFTCSAVDVCCDDWAMKDPSTNRYTYCCLPGSDPNSHGGCDKGRYPGFWVGRQGLVVTRTPCNENPKGMLAN